MKKLILTIIVVSALSGCTRVDETTEIAADSNTAITSDVGVDGSQPGNDMTSSDVGIQQPSSHAGPSCSGKTLSQLGLSYTTPFHVIMDIKRVGSGDRVRGADIRTSLGLPLTMQFETDEGDVTAKFDAALEISADANDHVEMVGTIRWQETGADAQNFTVRECIEAMGPLQDVKVTLSNGTEIVTHISISLDGV